MKKHTIKNIALLAIAGLGIITSAKAGITTANGDLFLGFYSTNSSTSYLVDLGTAASFRDFNGSETLSIGNIAADLTSIYGSGWATDSSLFYGVFGADYKTGVVNSTNFLNGDPSNTLYATSTGGGYSSSSNSGQGTPASKIDQMRQTAAGLNVTNSSNSSVAVIESNTTAGAFGFYVTNAGGTNFSSFNGGMTNFGASNSIALYRMVSSTSGGTGGVLDGTFTVGSNGSVVFATAVPEPSTVYMALGLVAFIGWHSRRRLSAIFKA
jgi:hypothetical protein